MSYQVIVTGLPATVNEDDVRDFFIRVGDVEDVHISKDETIICFRTEQDMEEALQINGMEFNENAVITVQRANEQNKNTDVKSTHNDTINANDDEESTLEKRSSNNDNDDAEKNEGNSHYHDEENDNNNHNEEKSEEDRRKAELLSWSVPEVNKVVVKNLTVSTTEQQLRELFKSCGEILDFYLAPGGHHAFIGFHENDGVDAALKLNGTDLNGTAIVVETKWIKSTSRSKNSYNNNLRSDDYRRDVYSSNNGRVSGRDGRVGYSGYTNSSDFEDTRIIVKNLPPDFTEEEVRDVLRGCGRIVDYYPNHDKCYTFIAFDHARAVPIALNRDGAEIRGVKVTVERRVDPKRGVKSNTEIALHDKLHNNNNMNSNTKPSLSTIRCHKCQELGHFARDCPEGALSSTPDYTHSHRGAVNLTKTNLTRFDASNYPFAPTQRVSRLPRSQLERAERIGENTAIHRSGSDRSNRPPDYRESVLRIAKTTPMPPPPSYKTQREERGVNYSHRVSERVATTTSRYGDVRHNDERKDEDEEEKRQNRYRPLSSNEDRRREINKYDNDDKNNNTRFKSYDEADEKLQHSRLEYSSKTSSRAAIGVSSVNNESRAVHRSISKTNEKEFPRHQYHDNNRAKRDNSYSASRSNSTRSMNSRSSSTNDTARSGSNEENRRKRRRSEAQNRSTQEKESSYHNHHHKHHHHHEYRNDKGHISNSQHYSPSDLNAKTHSEKEKGEYPNEMKSSPKFYDYNHRSYDKGNADERRYDVEEGTSRVRAGTSNSRLPPSNLQESSALLKSAATRSTYLDASNVKSSIPLQRYTRDDVPRRRSPSLERYKTTNSRNRADEARRRSRSPPYTRERNVPRYEEREGILYKECINKQNIEENFSNKYCYVNNN